MTYRILARKTRPQDFSAVVGQEATVQALRNAVGAGKVASAYLFSGIRGVGKTSVARILAKALNCEKGPSSDPCNECVICREITSGSDLDVLEIDAATYSKVEQVRELTESLKYGPARDRYKVVILDEIHRLSKQAFDALLKIVEEPPEHLVFLFATTDSHAVPATILSRCQEFNFRRVPFQALTDHLRALCKAEGFEASDTALRMIARAGDGSVRDAVALLDQLSIYGSDKIEDEDASHLLGGLDAALYHRLLEAVLTGDSSGVLQVVAEIEAAGWDPRLAYAEFLAYCRDALHLTLGGAEEQIDLPRDEVQALAELCARPQAGRKNLLRLLHHLLKSENTVRRTEAGALALEIVWLRMAELPQLGRIEDLLDGSAPAGKPEPKGRSATATASETVSRQAGSSANSAARADASGAPGPAGPLEPAEPVGLSSELAAEPATGTTGHLSDKTTASVQSTEMLDEPLVPEVPEPAEVLELGEQVELVGPAESAEPGSGAAGSGAARGSAGATDPADEKVQELLLQVSRRKQSLAAHLAGAAKLEFSDNMLSIHLPPQDALFKNALERQSNRLLLNECIQRVWTDAAAWRSVETSAPDPGAAATEAAKTESAPAEPDPALQHPTVQAALDIFGGTARSVGPDDK
jgi:DNA polymerase-3 subunit gamma/tau